MSLSLAQASFRLCRLLVSGSLGALTMRTVTCTVGHSVVMRATHGYVWNLSTKNVTPPKTENNDGERTFLESHVLVFFHCPLFRTLPRVE